MIELFVSFIFGMVVMDFMWAWKMGIPQRMWYRFKHRNDHKTSTAEVSEEQ